jgi:hypothetical protein
VASQWNHDVHWSGHECIGQWVCCTGWKSGLNIKKHSNIRRWVSSQSGDEISASWIAGNTVSPCSLAKMICMSSFYCRKCHHSHALLLHIWFPQLLKSWLYLHHKKMHTCLHCRNLAEVSVNTCTCLVQTVWQEMS